MDAGRQGGRIKAPQTKLIRPFTAQERAKGTLDDASQQVVPASHQLYVGGIRCARFWDAFQESVRSGPFVDASSKDSPSLQ
jgi:hypothetical protein